MSFFLFAVLKLNQNLLEEEWRNNNKKSTLSVSACLCLEFPFC